LVRETRSFRNGRINHGGKKKAQEIDQKRKAKDQKEMRP
jgi:hypothetical protein